MDQQAGESVKAATQKLIAKQGELLNLMDLIQEDFQRHETHPRTFLEETLTEIKSLWNTFLLNHGKICEDPAALTTAYYLEKRISTAKYKNSDITRAVHQQLDALVPRSPSVAQSIISSNSTKLPRLNLPSFSGSYMEWESFRDLFESVVHQNQSLTDVQRLHYLRTCLTGEALARIAGMPLTDEEYTGAWSALRERYDNKRLLVSNHVGHLISLPAIKRDSASDLRSLCDNTARVLRSMENLGRKDNLGNDICVYLTVQRLSPSVRKDWEKHLGDNTSPPNLSDLLKFLESSIRALESAASNAPKQAQSQESSTTRSRPQKTHAHLTTSESARSCPCCQGNHYIGRCAEFKKLKPEQRKRLAVQNKLCLNCLSCSHSINNCKSEHKCLKCKQTHHSLLHEESSASASDDKKPSSEPTTTQTVVNMHLASHESWEPSPVLLATAMVVLRSSTGRCCRVRALLDQGAESCFISENAVQMLRLSKRRVDAPIFSIGESHTATAKSAVHVDLGSVHNPNVNVKLVALVLPRLSKAKPPKMPSTRWPHLEGLELADPSYDSSAKIELIIGADVYGPLLRNGVRQGAPGSPTAQRTVLGWILSGKVCDNSRPAPRVIGAHSASLGKTTDHQISHLISRFWEIEELQSTRALTADEQECEKNFITTHQRNEDGRYTVRLPFKQTPLPDFQSSRIIAVHRLEHLERRLARDSKLSSEYSTFLQEYETLGHMIPTKLSDSPSNTYYMPHHAVIRETSTTTKLRVVFNASQKTKEGVSLNETMYTGPALQKDLFAVILKWRTHRHVFSADIEKMYRQIRVHADDHQFQRIVWRNEPTAPIQDYALTTVTYGTASAPYLALRTLQQLAADEEARFPLGAAVLREDFYVDDLLSGAEDLDGALARQREIITLLAAGGFRLRKWIANDPALIQSIPEEDRLKPSSRVLQPDEHVRTLGVQWNATTDTFHFQVSSICRNEPPTKRKVLSVIARLFDPLGWLAPVVIKAKILMQRLWSAQLDWDQALPDELSDEWNTYLKELPQLTDLAIPRWTKQTSNSIEFHGFCDASLHAYAAAVYIRVTSSDERSHVVLLAAKTKVAPLKQISIPRLELCGALLLTRLLNIVSTSMGYTKVPTHAWTDSKIVLAWLTGHPTRWTCFVANRVSEIQSSKVIISWHHVQSKDNPADSASRGVNPSELASNDLWWHGPAWLQQSPSHWPKDRTPVSEDAAPEERRNVHAHLAETPKEHELLSRYSSFRKLLRITTYCRRFASNARAPPHLRKHGFLSAAELSDARTLWIRNVQLLFFDEEFKALRSNESLPKRSPLLRCAPFIDNHSILRIGGRLRNSPLLFNERHPSIIPKGSHLASLLIAEAHHQTLHGGAQLTWSHLLRRYWILGGRSAVRSYIHRCITCFRFRARGETQQMGDLPSARISPSSPFSKTGVDYAGPIQLRALTGRGYRSHKGYIALFVCLSTKAIHLEAVSDYSTAAFLAAYRRFVARRGQCSEIWSDNGSNFKGAEQELRAMHLAISSHLQEIAPLIANDGTRWRFIPPAAPHFGGIWEAGVKSTKHHLKRFIGDTVLTFEELSTVLAQIEACLNSRPLSPLSSDPTDVRALTPGHFLIGRPLTSVPEPSLTEIPVNRLSRWQLTQKISEHFWSRWSNEYLHHLQQRGKWNAVTPNVQPGMLVLLKDERLPPTKWMLGRILEVHPGKDGLVRVVTVKTSTTTLKRPIAKICPLPLEPPPPESAASADLSTSTAALAMAGGTQEPTTSDRSSAV